MIHLQLVKWIHAFYKNVEPESFFLIIIPRGRCLQILLCRAHSNLNSLLIVLARKKLFRKSWNELFTVFWRVTCCCHENTESPLKSKSWSSFPAAKRLREEFFQPNNCLKIMKKNVFEYVAYFSLNKSQLMTIHFLHISWKLQLNKTFLFVLDCLFISPQTFLPQQFSKDKILTKPAWTAPHNNENKPKISRGDIGVNKRRRIFYNTSVPHEVVGGGLLSSHIFQSSGNGESSGSSRQRKRKSLGLCLSESN